MNKQKLKSKLIFQKNFPTEGVNFLDIPWSLENKGVFKEMKVLMTAELSSYVRDYGLPTVVVAVETRGLIFGGMLADLLNARFVLARKKPNSAREYEEVEVKNEYATQTLYFPKRAVISSDHVLIHDDVLATGGTINAIHEHLKETYRIMTCHAHVLVDLSLPSFQKKEGLTIISNLKL